MSTIGSWNIDAFAARPDLDKPGFFNNSPDHRTAFWGIYASRPRTGRFSIDVYYTGLDRKVATYNRGTGQELRHSAAARLWRPVQTKERGWDFDYEGVWQFGTFGSHAIRAWTFASDTGYSLPNLPFKPRLSVKSDISSGDDPRHNSLGTFNALFPIGNYFGVLADTAHDQQIRSIALTADGTRLATASRDGIIKIWDTRSAYNSEVESLVQSLYQKLNFATDVIEELRSSPSVDESIRGPALLLVQQQGERDPVGHIRASWQIVKAGGARRDACELALRHARVACELTPWNWETFNAQGAAQYRLGAYRAALASFLHAAEVRARPSISNLALQTLAYEGLAENSKARSKLEELERLLPRSWDVDGDLRALVQEARSAVERASR